MSCSSDDQSDKECPLCMEAFEIDDVNFYPCKCEYQICRFCWHRIRTDENGLCPACRQPYPEDPVNFKPLSTAELQQIKSEKKLKAQSEKQRISESRKHLASYRVLQRNLVYVVGLSQRVADAEVLKRPEYFGKFGKILKVVVGCTANAPPNMVSSHTAYVTYSRVDEALRAIQGVNNATVDGRYVKASLGTTKYCSAFLRSQQCYKPECMYLHDIADSEISFTKDDMHLGKHAEYERRLIEAVLLRPQQIAAATSSAQHANAPVAAVQPVPRMPPVPPKASGSDDRINEAWNSNTSEWDDDDAKGEDIGYIEDDLPTLEEAHAIHKESKRKEYEYAKQAQAEEQRRKLEAEKERKRIEEEEVERQRREREEQARLDAERLEVERLKKEAEESARKEEERIRREAAEEQERQRKIEEAARAAAAEADADARKENNFVESMTKALPNVSRLHSWTKNAEHCSIDSPINAPAPVTSWQALLGLTPSEPAHLPSMMTDTAPITGPLFPGSHGLGPAPGLPAPTSLAAPTPMSSAQSVFSRHTVMPTPPPGLGFGADDDLGFDPFSESSKGLADLLEEERRFQAPPHLTSSAPFGHSSHNPFSSASAAQAAFQQQAQAAAASQLSYMNNMNGGHYNQLQHMLAQQQHLRERVERETREQATLQALGTEQWVRMFQQQQQNQHTQHQQSHQSQSQNHYAGVFGNVQQQQHQRHGHPLDLFAQNGLDSQTSSAYAPPPGLGHPSQRSQQSVSSNSGHFLNHNQTATMQQQARDQHQQPKSSSLTEWQEGLKALLPNVNIRFAPDIDQARWSQSSSGPVSGSQQGAQPHMSASSIFGAEQQQQREAPNPRLMQHIPPPPGFSIPATR